LLRALQPDHQNEAVEFEIEESDKGPRATNVKKAVAV
jgi:cold shock CspA family protein